MKKILLINNLTKHLEELQEILKPNEIITVPFYKIPKDYSIFDAIILSGGSKYRIKDKGYKFREEIEIIKNTSIPIFGICLGFELICYVYKESLEKLKEKEKCIKEIEILKRDKIFEGVKELKVFEAHKFYVKEVNNLIPLAKSKTGIEIVRHLTKPIYGVQFHPEIRLENNNGFKVLKNFLKNLK